jgi:Terminase large subunit, T4likevirus-type, N-terminal/Terminase RNaseH-like domain
MAATAASSPTVFARRVLGIEPHPAQRELLECRARHRVACCGRRWGKSTAAAIDVLHFAMTRPGTTQMVVAPTADQAAIIFDMAHRLAQESPLRPLLERVVQSPFPELVLLSAPGTRSTVMVRPSGHAGDYLRGHGADRVVVDEAAFVPELVLQQVVPPMLAASRYGQQLWISTPFGHNTFWQAFVRGQENDPHIRSFQYPSCSNPTLSRAYLEQQRQQMSELAYATEILAQFRDDQASVFSWALIERAVDDSLHVGMPPELGKRYAIGFDPAKLNDRSGVVVVELPEAPAEVLRVVGVRDIGRRDYTLQATEVGRLSQRYNRARVLMDSTKHDQLLDFMRSQNVPADGYHFTSQSKGELIDGLVMKLEQDRLSLPNYAPLIEELKYYRYELTTAGNVRLGGGDRSHDDLVTALALATHKPYKQVMQWA